jgi:hypothetical protein
MMQLIARGLIFDSAGRQPSERVTFFPGLCRLQSGTWLSGFTIGEKKHALNGTIRIAQSVDGEHWEELPCRFNSVIDGIPGSLAGGEMLEVSPGRLLLFASWFDRSEPERPMIDPETEGIWHSRLLMCSSEDNGRTWGPWKEVLTPGLTGCALTGPPLIWSDGTIGLAFESFKHFDDPAPARHAAWLALSENGGDSFDRLCLVAQDPQHQVYYWDQRLSAGSAPGDFTGLFWTHDRLRQQDLTVHILSASIHARSMEQNQIRSTSIPGQIAAPVALTEDTLLAFVVDREHPGTLRLWRSSDRGQSWPPEDSLIVHTHDERAALSQGKFQIDFNQYWDDMQKWSFGHPAARMIDDNHVLLAFYAGLPNQMSIHWAKVRLES